ncbi:TIGR01777 family oxidoreductase [Pseudomonadota bacterium]
MEIINWVLTLLIVQGVLGAIDTLYHHEMTVALPQRPGAKKELAIHSVRALLYAVVFAAIAKFEFHGAWIAFISIIVVIEVALTLWDFIVEDNSRKLPSSERILHTILAINGGAVFGLYAWQLAQWSALPTALVGVDYGWASHILILFAIGVALSGIRDGLAAWRLDNTAAAPNPFIGIENRRILVTGGTGFIGEAVVNQLLDAGHNVTVWVRDPIRAAYLFDGRARCVRDMNTLDSSEHFDAIINLAGAPVIGPRWSTKRKTQLMASRLNTTQAVLKWVEQATTRPTTWIQASAIGYYGVRNASEALNETSSKGGGFMSELCANWEEAAHAAETLGLKRITLRLGLVFGPGGALPPLLLPYYFGLGGRMGSGKQVMSWIHRDDVLKLIAEAISNETMQGTYNAVAPDAITQAEFAHTVGKTLKRPVWLHLPATPIRWLAGEMAQLFVDGQRVTPNRLLSQGFKFRHPTLKGALRDLV